MTTQLPTIAELEPGTVFEFHTVFGSKTFVRIPRWREKPDNPHVIASCLTDSRCRLIDVPHADCRPERILRNPDGSPWEQPVTEHDVIGEQRLREHFERCQREGRQCKVRLRNGETARVLCVDSPAAGGPVLGDGDSNYVYTWGVDGYHGYDPHDIIASATEPQVVWVPVFRDVNGRLDCYCGEASKEDAETKGRELSGNDFIRAQRVELKEADDA